MGAYTERPSEHTYTEITSNHRIVKNGGGGGGLSHYPLMATIVAICPNCVFFVAELANLTLAHSLP